jgi:2-succinyl-5-enolpyruvyl-6-hydroxy-3-cyclohexene-1-carboxylate synthase
VHLNFSLREPLVLDHPLEGEEPGGGGREGDRPWVTRPRTHAEPAAAVVEGLAAELKARARPVLVAGRSERDPKLAVVLAELAEQAKIPLLADPLSGARRGPAAIAHYDALLRDPDWAADHAPDLVLRVGDLPTSKPLRTWLHGLDGALQIALDAEQAWQDPAGAVGTILTGDPRATLEALAAHLKRRRDAAWLERWRRADHAAGGAIAHVLGAAGLSEPRVAAELGARLPEAATVVVASSMPVRDVETFFPARHAPPRVLSNRGANGIDGTVSTAYGVAAAARGPVVLLIGDVALAHDVGGLLANVRPGLKLTIVLLDNDGGGIFDFLPVSGTEPHERYREHVATPHGLDFSHAAALYGCDFESADGIDGFRSALERAFASDRTAIVHVRTERPANVALHRDVWDAVARSVRDAA